MNEKIERISKVEGALEAGELESLEKVSKLDTSQVINKDHFENIISQERKKESLQTQELDSSKKPSLIDEVRDLNNKVDGWRVALQPSDLADQARVAMVQIDQIKDKLATPNLDIKPSVQNLLKRKLTHIDENLKIALDRAGLEYQAVKPDDLKVATNPIERFLGLLTSGQEKLKMISSEISSLDREHINPADLLAIQVKVNYTSQELEFFTNLLNKSLESTKTLMNVQV